MQWSFPNKKKKGSGKARGQHNPGDEENTFKTVLNDDSDRDRRKKGKGEQKPSSQQPSSSSSRSVTSPAAGGGTTRGRGARGGGYASRGSGGGGGNRSGLNGYRRAEDHSSVRRRGRGTFNASMSGGGHAGGGGLGGATAWPEGGGRRLGGREDWTGPRRSGGGRGGGFGFDDGGCVRTTEGMVLFWKEPACFVQWTPCSFDLDGERYCNAEQWMMASKARLFNDRTALQQIMATADPRRQKALGRQVRGFDPAVWDKKGYDVVVRGNLAKFMQNPGFRDELLATGDRILAEASPYDSEWGIGLHANDADALIQARWPGRNKLGEALMDVRSQLRDEAYNEDQKEQRGDEKEEEEEGAEWVRDDGRAAYGTDEDWVMDDPPVHDDEDERVGRSRKYK